MNESDTPRTDAAAQGFSAVNINFARTLERELGEAKAKLSKLSRMIDIADQSNDSASEAEVANSATFAEALAHTNTEMVEAERDQWRSLSEQLAQELTDNLAPGLTSPALDEYEKLKQSSE